MNSTNVTFFGFNQSVSVILTLRISTLSLQFLTSFPLNCYIVFLLLSRGVDACVFWVNNAIAEILFSISSLLFVIYMENSRFFAVELVRFFIRISMSARLLFLCCVSLERYLAVVHPVTFLRLKALRYRVVCSVVVWMCSLVLGIIGGTLPLAISKLWVAVNIIILAVEFFCCVSILRRLRDPGPRDMGREQGEMNAAKKKAFLIVFINLLTCLAQNIPMVVTYSLENLLHDYEFKMLEIISYMINIFVAFVQPFYILCNAGRLSIIRCC